MPRPDGTPLWQHASALAALAHHGQIRKDGRTPYFSHPVRVTLTVAAVFGITDEVILTAALLHDVIEDTLVDYDDLLDGFGSEIADIVSALSKDPRCPEPQREKSYDEQLARGPWQARLIKLADVYDNMLDCNDDNARRRLIKKAQRAVLLTESDVDLEHSRKIVQNAIAEIEARIGRTMG